MKLMTSYDLYTRATAVSTTYTRKSLKYIYTIRNAYYTFNVFFDTSKIIYFNI